MDNKQILERAIEKAIAGGWKNEEIYSADDHGRACLFNPGLGEYGGHEDVSVLIFNHEFAKALWGEQPSSTIYLAASTLTEVDAGWSTHKPMPQWKHHLREMVIAPDPIKYIGENI